MSTAAIPPRPEPSVLATRPGAILLAGLIVSLLVHAVVIYQAIDRPIGYIDPRALQAERAPIRVKRAAYDQILTPTAAAGAAAEEALSLADVSRTLLDDVAPPGLDDRYEPDLQPRELDQGLPDPATQLAVELPAFEIPQDLLEAQPSRAPQELAFQSIDQAGFGGGGAGAGGEGLGTPGAGSARARDLLRETGLVAGVRPRSPVSDMSAIDQGPSLDQHLAEPTTSGPAIDFTAIALQGTTELEVPERLDQDFDYFLTTYRDRGAEDAYFRVDIVPRRSLHKLKAMPKDVIYLVDTSSSIPQGWVEQMSEGVRQALASLNAGDRFNIVLFKDNPAFFSTRGPQEATPENIAAASRFLTSARSDGYTDVNAAMGQLLVRDVAADRVYNLVLISDGQPTKGVVDTRDLINLITRDNDLAASIYCVGIGRQPNRELLEFMAYRNKGYCEFAFRQEHVAPAIRNLASRLRYPLIKNVQVRFAGQGVSEVYPVHLPNIHQAERFSLYGRYARETPFTVQIDGNSAGRPVDFTFARDPATAPAGEKQIAQDWAFQKLHHLYSELLRRGNSPDLLAQIEEIRKRYGLKTLY